MPHTTSRRRLARLVAAPAAAALGAGLLVVTPSAQALTSVSTSNGATVNINDARRPGLDTGSIRNVSGSRMEGFGNIFVHVDTPADEAPRMNDQMMRGFGLLARLLHLDEVGAPGRPADDPQGAGAVVDQHHELLRHLHQHVRRAADVQGVVRRLARLGVHPDQPEQGHRQRVQQR
jgi:hypothetical protein